MCVRHLEKPPSRNGFHSQYSSQWSSFMVLVTYFPFYMSRLFHYILIEMFCSGCKWNSRSLKVTICEIKFDSAYHWFNSFMNSYKHCVPKMSQKNKARLIVTMWNRNKLYLWMQQTAVIVIDSIIIIVFALNLHTVIALSI